MKASELKSIRLEIRFDPRDMCCVLDLPRRTYQDYEAGKRNIPVEVANRIREIYRRDREFMAGIAYRVDQALDKEYPGGLIPSAPCKDIFNEL